MTDKKKILTIDGGGVRGLIALGVLEQIEATLRHETNNPDLLLCDYFDYISGTSTGAILATALSIGMSTEEIRPFYLHCTKEILKKAGLSKRLYYKYQSESLKRILQEILGDATLGSDILKTNYMIVMRNASTGSPWVMSNNPLAMFNDRSLPDCNLDLPLWQLVRASTAAPSFFEPETIQVADKEFHFVDGGVTPYNNPSFQTFLMATTDVYKMQWQTGTDKLLLVSVGTGMEPQVKKLLKTSDMHLGYIATETPNALISSASAEQDMLCRVFGECLYGKEIDMEVGDLIGSMGPVTDKLFTYMRYNIHLTQDGLSEVGIDDIRPDDVWAMDNIDHIDELNRVGQAVGKEQVRAEHFAKFV